MKRNKGFSLIELMIVVGIIGILVSIALPMYRNYILRVRILETVNAVTLLLRDAAIGLGSGDLMAGLDVEEIGKKVGDTPWMGSSTWHMGCQNGVRMAEVAVSKDKLGHVGISLPYIWQLVIYGPTRTLCDRDYNDIQEGFEITITLDVDALGVPNKSGRKNYNMLQLAVSDEVVYKDVEGNITRKEVGAVLSCGIRPSFVGDDDFAEAMAKYDFPLASIPPMCRYYRMAGAMPRTLVELSS